MEGQILVACRDSHCRDNLLKSFSDQNLSVSCIGDDADLLLEILERDYDAIIYDLEFSSIDSLKMVKLLRKIRPKFPLIILTSDASIELGGKLLQEGVAYYALKPLHADTLRQVLPNVLNNGQSKSLGNNSNNKLNYGGDHETVETTNRRRAGANLYFRDSCYYGANPGSGNCC